MLRRPAAFVAAFTIATSTGLAFAQSSAPDFTRLVVKVGSKSAQATLGYHCVPDGAGSGACEEADYPLKTKDTVSVRRGGEVTLLLGAPAGYVAWRAARVGGGGKEVSVATGEARSATRTGKRWKLRLPKDLRRSARILGFYVVADSHFADFEIATTVG